MEFVKNPRNFSASPQGHHPEHEARKMLYFITNRGFVSKCQWRALESCMNFCGEML